MTIPLAIRSPTPCAHPADGSVCAACKVRSISICAALSHDELQSLSELARDFIYEPGVAFAVQGERAESLWNLTEGMVRMTRLLPDGRRQILGFLLPGDFLGLSLQAEYGFSAEAVGRVRACRFSRRPFEALLRRFPHLLRRLLDAASHEIGLGHDHAVTLGRQTAAERVASLIVSLRDRRRAMGGDDAQVPLPMTRQDMADFLGLTIETVSRTLTGLARGGTIRLTRGGAELLKPRHLEELAAH